MKRVWTFLGILTAFNAVFLAFALAIMLLVPEDWKGLSLIVVCFAAFGSIPLAVWLDYEIPGGRQ